MNIRRILVPIDYSPGSLNALETAVSLADRLGAEADALYVLDVPGGRPAHELETFVALAERTDGTRIGTRIERGDAGPVIARIAEQDDYDLIVMGTHGRTGFRRAIAGSVAELVVRISIVPVLTVRLGPPRVAARADGSAGARRRASARARGGAPPRLRARRG